jgi:hypothetical protein
MQILYNFIYLKCKLFNNKKMHISILENIQINIFFCYVKKSDILKYV